MIAAATLSAGDRTDVLYCVHTVLRRRSEGGGEPESEAVRDAAGWVDLPELTGILLERFYMMHRGRRSQG